MIVFLCTKRKYQFHDTAIEKIYLMVEPGPTIIPGMDGTLYIQDENDDEKILKVNWRQGYKIHADPVDLIYTVMKM